MSETARLPRPSPAAQMSPVSQASPAALDSAVARSSAVLAAGNDDVSLAVRTISGELSEVAWSNLACRILFRCAILEGTPHRARFVAQVLSARGHIEAARLLADHGASTGAKPWQKRRLAELRDALPTNDSVASVRGRFRLDIDDDGQVHVSDKGGDSVRTGSSEFPAGKFSAGDERRCESVPSWLSDVIGLLEREPVGIHHDVLMIPVGNTARALRTLRSVLPALRLLPVVPVLLAASPTEVPDLLTSLAPVPAADRYRRADRLSLVIASLTGSGRYGLITAGGGELLDAGPAEDLVLSTVDDLAAVASAVGLFDLYESPVLSTHRAELVDAFRTEAAALLPVRNSTRAFSRAMRFRGTARATSQLRGRLMDHLVASGFFDEARGLLDAAAPSERDRVHGALEVRSIRGASGERSAPSSDHHEFDSVDAFAGPTPGESSVYSIALGGLPIDLRFDDRGHDTTIVFFHPAVTKAVKRYPLFSGGTFSEYLEANRLFISDPSLYVDRRLKLGWFAGNRHQPTLQDDLARIISRFIRPRGRLIFFGASGGGFASLYYATKFPGSTAVPVNPQTTIGAYTPAVVNRYLSYSWDGSALDDLPVCTDVRTLYRNPVENTVVYVQNTGDHDHRDNHYAPFMDALPDSHRVSPLLVDAGEGHVPPPRDQLAGILADVIGDV